MLKVLFTRHAQTIANVNMLVQGHEHGDINEKGFEQIGKLSERLSDESIDLIISSDSPRCKITTEGLNKDCQIHLIYDKFLREKDGGDWAGRKAHEVNWDELEGDFENKKAPNGESLIEVRDRARKFIKELLKNYGDSDKKILVVSHGAFLKVLIGDLLGMDLRSSIFKLFIDHCSLTLVEFGGKHSEGYQVKFINENDFLGDSRNWINVK